MPTLFEVRRDLFSALLSAGIVEHEARREVELIVEHVTGWKLARQLVNDGKPLAPDWVDSIESIKEQRLRRKPLQYLLGETGFMGLTLACAEGVLIPRPDTETLVTVALSYLSGVREPKVFDVGSGSGAVAVSLLKLRSDARIWAADISALAVALTLKNARRQGVEDRLHLMCGDWLECRPPEPVNMLVSNPPYIPSSQRPGLPPEVADWEPEAALFGPDEDGLGFFRQLSAEGKGLVLPGGVLAVEVGDGQAQAVCEIFQANGWLQREIHTDLNKLPRVVSAFRATSPF